jgi:hypothetical protein
MLNRNRFEFDPSDHHGPGQGYLAAITNGISIEQIDCCIGRIDRAGGAFGEAGGVIGMRMREHDGRWSNGTDTIQPVRSAIDHDASTAVANKGRAMTPMSTGAGLDLATRAQKRQLEHLLSQS